MKGYLVISYRAINPPSPALKYCVQACGLMTTYRFGASEMTRLDQELQCRPLPGQVHS